MDYREQPLVSFSFSHVPSSISPTSAVSSVHFRGWPHVSSREVRDA